MLDNSGTVEKPDSALSAAVAWIAAHPEGVSVHEIKERFGLSAKEACEAIAMARAVNQHGGQGR